MQAMLGPLTGRPAAGRVFRLLGGALCAAWFMLATAARASDTFTKEDRIVGTYFFIWYKYGAPNRPGFFNHIVNPDGSDALSFHPPNLEQMDYSNVAWFKKELHDMMEAGIDVAIVDWWAGPAMVEWSIEALQTLVKAEKELIAEGLHPPKIAMLYETMGLIIHEDLRDLTQGEGLETLYEGVRVFYHIVPRELWAKIDGRPMMWTYVPEHRARYDRKVFERVKGKFAGEFGVKPYVIKEASWEAEADATYHWGAALTHVKFADVVSVGPGWDSRGVPQNTIPEVPRDGGRV